MKYKGLSVIIRNEKEYNIIKEFLGDYLYLDFVPQMNDVETSIVIHYDDTDFLSTGSVGSSAYQAKYGCRLVEYNKFFMLPL